MSDHHRPATRPWRKPMPARDPDEEHRQSSFLELLFDLCFVVAVAQAAAGLHHALAAQHVADGVVGYLTVFFAIWWAWMNFTWFASSYDNDDVPYRLATFVQIAGALILAAGVPRGFEHADYDIVFFGYVVMRVALVALWLRAARHDPGRRTTALRYAAGISVAMLGWGTMVVAGAWPQWGWWLMAAVELAVPIWAEHAAKTQWHPEHIAERYGLFTIIVLGESVLSATLAVQSAIEARIDGWTLAETAGGGLLLMASLWWIYFAKPAHPFLRTRVAAFVWGYGHYFIFAAVAAVGAGLAVNLDTASGHGAHDAGEATAAAVTVPVAVYLAVLWCLQVRPHRTGLVPALAYLAAIAGVLAATFTPWPILVAGLITTALVSVFVASAARVQAVPD